jgi:hypothetical protein
MTDNATFPYVVITSINVEAGDDGKVVVDSDAINGSTATFLADLKEIGNTFSSKEKKFDAKKLDPTEARSRILKDIEGTNKTPLFCVHGYSTEPISVLSKAMERYEVMENSKYYPVFVIWPCSGWFNSKKGTTTGYNKDSDIYAPNAGETFFDFVKQIPDNTFPRKSLMMHSMGNHVVFDGACYLGTPEAQFENIFLVAADVPHDIFMKNPNEDYEGENKRIWGDKNKKASNFYNLLAKGADQKPKGKIVVLHNGDDKALFWSSWAENWERRIGQRGMAKKRGGFLDLGFEDDGENVLDIFKDIYVNEDMQSEFGGLGIGHGYQFDPATVKVFDKYAL